MIIHTLLSFTLVVSTVNASAGNSPGQGEVNAPPIVRFRPSLSDKLTAMILQYAMYDIDAKTLTSDPALDLTQLYNKHQKQFVRVLGVEVVGAGKAQLNGFYHRLESAWGPPRAYKTDCCRRKKLRKWKEETEGRPWYEKEDGCYIYWNSKSKKWYLLPPRGFNHYLANADTCMPPSAWIAHVKKTYAAGKSKGMTFSQATVAAKKTYRKPASATATAFPPTGLWDWIPGGPGSRGRHNAEWCPNPTLRLMS